jgi:hypothetical protein
MDNGTMTLKKWLIENERCFARQMEEIEEEKKKNAAFRERAMPSIVNHELLVLRSVIVWIEKLVIEQVLQVNRSWIHTHRLYSVKRIRDALGTNTSITIGDVLVTSALLIQIETEMGKRFSAEDKEVLTSVIGDFNAAVYLDPRRYWEESGVDEEEKALKDLVDRVLVKRDRRKRDLLHTLINDYCKLRLESESSIPAQENDLSNDASI